LSLSENKNTPSFKVAGGCRGDNKDKTWEIRIMISINVDLRIKNMNNKKNNNKDKDKRRSKNKNRSENSKTRTRTRTRTRIKRNLVFSKPQQTPLIPESESPRTVKKITMLHSHSYSENTVKVLRTRSTWSKR
jgi:hypothetical protein